METAVVIRVPEAEPAIGAHRREHTPSGAEGMPAHVTILVPFADSALLVAGMVREHPIPLRPSPGSGSL